MMRVPFSSPVCRLPTTTRTILTRCHATASRSNGPAPALGRHKKAHHQGNKQRWHPQAFESPAYNPRPVPTDTDSPDLSQPTRHDIAAAAHKIEFPSVFSLHFLKVQCASNANIKAHYSQNHVFHQQDLKWFDDPEHANAGCVLDRYIAASDGSRPLWWSVLALGGNTASPFVCTTAQRLLNRAIRLALEENGYDRYGRRLVAHGVQPPKNNPLDLYGTLRVQCLQPKALCQLKFETQILEIGRAIIAAALRRLVASNDKPARAVRGDPAGRRFDSRNRFSRPDRGSNMTGYAQKW